jgi:hypothetical protein
MTESGGAGSSERYGVPRVGLRPLLAGHGARAWPMTEDTGAANGISDPRP